MASYSKSFKKRAVARLLPPESAAVDAVSRELGVSTATLDRWRAEALVETAALLVLSKKLSAVFEDGVDA